MNQRSRRAFVNVPPPISPGRSSGDYRPTGNTSDLAVGPNLANYKFSYYGDNQMAGSGSTAKQLAGKAVQAGVEYVKNNPEQIIQGIQGVYSSISGSGKGESRPSGSVLSPNPNPKETHLNTGIRLTVLQSPFQDAVENVCSPLHMSTALFMFPIVATTTVYDFFMKVLVYESQTSAQNNVNWAIDIINKFSATKILIALNALFNALQVYFFYRSIDVYSNYPGINQNLGMKTLRESFDYDTLEKLNVLSRILVRTPCPPNMLEFCRYMHSNYTSGDTAGSSIIKVAPHGPVSTAVYIDNTKIQAAIDALTLDDNVQVYLTLFRAVKNWVLMDTSKLYDPPTDLLYDKDFITIFNNLPFKTNIAGAVFNPRIATLGTNFSYNSYTNNLDGAAVALTDVYVSAAPSGYALGINSVPETGSESRFSFYKVGATTGWYSPSGIPFLQQSRQETYQSNGTVVTSRHTFGSDMVENLSPSMQKVAGVDFLNWLMSNNTIVKPSMFNDSSRGRGRGKSRSRGN